MHLCHVIWILLAHILCAHSQMVYVVPVENPTYAEEYRCVVDSNPENTTYSWHRQGRSSLPDGVRAEGERLHFLKSDSKLNGLYICEAVNQLGAASGSLYRHMNSRTEL